MNSTELVTFEKGEARTTSLILAEGSGVEHKAVIQLVRKYENDLEEFGRVTFEMRPFETSGGIQKREIALLNEQQATLIMTYMKNTPIVREFKKALVRAFFELRDMARGNSADKRIDVNMNHTRGVTNAHGLDIKYSLDLTKILQRPTRKGLQLLERLTGVSMDDLLPDDSQIPDMPAVSVLFNTWESAHIIAQPGATTGASIIFDNFKEWYQQSTGLPVPSQKWFGGEMNRRGYRKDKRSGTVIYLGISLAI